MLDLRRAARACGCDLNATDADAAVAYPELGRLLGTAEAAADAAGAAGGEGAQAPVQALAPAPPAATLHMPERHRWGLPPACMQHRLRHLSGAFLGVGAAIRLCVHAWLQAAHPSRAGSAAAKP